ncbi:amidohydrolase family protein [Streptomyces sp. NPDC005562]|uniref:metal-dependent hydrolase family protein n=1 Tax=Streptomyces sp. NPDC005562 TaxID=3154890 RepID=UPI00339F87BC
MSTTPRARYTNARLIDGISAAPVIDAVLVVDDGGEIVYAGPATGAPATPGTPVTDLGGRTLLPGFIDAHVHFAVGSPGGLTGSLTTRASVRTFETARRMRQTLHAGITTARDLGGVDAGYREAVERGLIDGPRLRTAVRILSHTGGHGDFTLPSGVRINEDITALADTRDQARLETRKLLRDGADVIKLCATGGMSSPCDGPDDEGLTEEEIRAVVDETRRHGGRPVAAHAQGTTGIRNAVRAGVTSVEHGYGADAECRELMGEHGTFLVPTLSTVFRMPERGTIPDYHWQKKTRWAGITKENVGAAIEAGVTIALGTDSGMCPHAENLSELGYLVELGMNPMAAIHASTRNAARLLGMEDRVGTVEAGKLADFVVTDADPLTDIGALADASAIVLVAQGGRVCKDTRAGRPAGGTA